jgi:hypothetical protein
MPVGATSDNKRPISNAESPNVNLTIRREKRCFRPRNQDKGHKMDLTGAISGMQQSQVAGEVQIRVAQMILSDAQAQGAAEVQLIQSATGGQGDGASNGLGGRIDTHA